MNAAGRNFFFVLLHKIKLKSSGGVCSQNLLLQTFPRMETLRVAVAAKGQIISKAIFVFLTSSKKRMKMI